MGSPYSWRAPLLLASLAALAACGPQARGDRAWARGRVEEAVRAWQEAGELDEEHRQRLARALAGLGREEEAQELLDAIPRERWDDDAWMAQGLLLLAQGKPAEAAEAFARGDAPELQVNRCSALLAAGTPDESICAHALQAAPGDPAALLGLAASAFASGDPVVGRRALEDLLAGSPTPEQREEAARVAAVARAWGIACRALAGGGEPVGEPLERGRVCTLAGAWDEAHAALEPLVEQEPVAAFMLATLSLDRALLASDSGERERWTRDAWRWMERCRDALGRSPDWHVDAGRLHALDGDFERARAEYLRALELRPGDRLAAFNLARLLHRLGELDAARERARALWEREGAYQLDAGMDLARWSREAGDPEEARSVAEALVQRCANRSAPCLADASLLLAALEAEAGEHDAALGHLAQAIAAGGRRVQEEARAEPAFSGLRDDIRYANLVDHENEDPFAAIGGLPGCTPEPPAGEGEGALAGGNGGL